MASPQAENGHVDIAHEIIEALAKYRINGESWQCLMVVFRKTYGWKKTEDEISLSQFSEMTGLKRPNVARALAWLVSSKILCVIKEDTTYANKYRFNKDFDTWTPVIKKDTTPKAVIIEDNEVVSKKIIHPVSSKIHTKENSTKETPKESIALPAWLDLDLWKAFLEIRKNKRAPNTDHALLLNIQKLDKFRLSGMDPSDVLKQSIEKGYQGLFEVKGVSSTAIKQSTSRDAAGRELHYAK